MGVEPAIAIIDESQLAATPRGRSVFVDLGSLAPENVTPKEATLAGGQFATGNFRKALQLAAAGRADAVFFTPFNKKAMRLAYPGYDDEIRFINDVLGRTGPASEFNVLGQIWNARVTSHIPLSGVAAAITRDRSSDDSASSMKLAGRCSRGNISMPCL